MGQPLLSELSRRRKLALLLRHLPPGASVLEVGSGSGWFSEGLRRRGHPVMTLDIQGPADLVGDVNAWRDLGLGPGSFDAVVGLELIEHVDCLAAMRALCRPGGLIMLSSPHPRWDWVMKILEALRLTQRRTSPHDNLTDFAAIDMRALVRSRPLFIHQVAIFINDPRAPGFGPQ